MRPAPSIEICSGNVAGTRSADATDARTIVDVNLTSCRFVEIVWGAALSAHLKLFSRVRLAIPHAFRILRVPATLWP
jgi:hypothetical protein